ncbi:MAG: beta-glycosidase [Bacteroidales bacterium]|nr:beta-glycosidase [Bacteroidales bacterium]
MNRTAIPPTILRTLTLHFLLSHPYRPFSILLFSLLCLFLSLPTPAYSVPSSTQPCPPRETKGGPCGPSPYVLYHNLALHRTATASSAIDYNLTAHLVTDGICDATRPSVLTVSTPAGALPRREAEWTLDGGPYSRQILMGDTTWLRYDWSGPFALPARSIRLDARVAYRSDAARHGYNIEAQVSADGTHWTTIAAASGDGLPGKAMTYKLHADPNKQTGNDYLPARNLDLTLPLDSVSPEAFGHLRLCLRMEGAVHWDIHDLHFFDAAGREVWAQPSQQFCSMWMSNGGGPQWLCVDLGAPACVERIVPHWYHEPRRWHPIVSADGRYVTLVMQEAGAAGCYALRELEVWGTGGTVITPREAERPVADNLLPLNGGPWQLQRASEVHATGETVATQGFDTTGWIWATVPATALMSYVNIGAVPHPNYGDNAEQISESFFRSNFWYRREFDVTDDLLRSGAQQRLHFDGINWKANVFINGQRLGRVEGAFMRGDFDVTDHLRPGRNVLAVEIICNEHFGVVKEKDANTTQFNGGILGADNPTFHASIGWDWITTVRGRNAGIWNEVYLTTHDGIQLSDPYVRTHIADAAPVGTAASAAPNIEVTPSVVARNLTAEPLHGILHGWIGTVHFEREVTLAPHATEEFTFLPADYPQLVSPDFRLWWPNGYGEPYRYDAGFSFNTSSTHSLTYKAGLREMSYERPADSLLIRINGRHFVPMGGNWGMDEHNLCYRRREYDIAVGYHRDMHCTMIRNWVGMIGDEDFYEACDSLGLMIWQDFWLANPADGPDPYDETLFTDNARDYLLRMRRHPSIAIYCGRNEGFPSPTLDKALRDMVAHYAPGLAYLSSSADGGVTGHGPYSAQPARVYFQRQSGKIHTERGMPAVMNIESLERTLYPGALWPQSKQWGQHDYTLDGAQRAREFNSLVNRAFGERPVSARSFTRRAQLINYNGYRAMFESTSRHRAGLLIWMSHPCWPSMVWQTYDYYFDPTAAYFGTKKACEPLHIQYNALTDSIEIVNRYAGAHPCVRATAEVYDLYGRRVCRQRATLDSGNDTTLAWLTLAGLLPEVPSDVYFLRLTLHETRDGAKTLVSENTYIMGREEGNYQALNTLPQADVHLTTTLCSPDEQGRRSAVVRLHNRSQVPAPFLRLNLKNAAGEQVLPVVYSDNYITLMPGEQREIRVWWEEGGKDAEITIDPLKTP